MSVEVECEVQHYFTDLSSLADRMADRWSDRQMPDFPNLCTPANSVSAERVFSAAGLICNKIRALLTGKNVDAIIFLHANKELHAARSKVLDDVPVNHLRALLVSREEKSEAEEEDTLPLPDLRCEN